MTTPDVFEALVAAAADPKAEIRAAAADALASAAILASSRRKRAPAVKALVSTLSDREAEVRAQGATGFTAMNRMVGEPIPDQVIPKLRRLLSGDLSSEVRSAAALALGRSPRTPATLAALAAALTDKDEWVRRRAADALEALRPNRAAVPALVGALREPATAGAARRALERMETAVQKKVTVGLAPLKRRLAEAIQRGPRGRDLDLDSETESLVAALGPHAAPLLPKLLEVWDDLDAPGINDALEQTGLEGARELMRCLRQGNVALRAAAATALVAFWGYPDAVSALAAATRDPDDRVRAAAVRALSLALPAGS